MKTDTGLAQIEFSLLGPMQVRVSGVLAPVPAGKQRAVLAALLLNANRVTGLDELADTLWGSMSPPSARVSVQNHVMRLRKALGDTGRARIGTEPGGYLITVRTGELDVLRFEALLGQARTAAGDGSWALSAARANEALALWRGDPLTDAGSDALALREVPRLTEMRLQALTLRIAADVELGRHAGVIGELRQLTGLHPMRERLHELLMLAMYRDGRQAEALAAYRQARDTLVDELGTEPGPRLQALHLRILAADPALSDPALSDPALSKTDQALSDTTNLARVPRQIPGTVRQFTGRTGELAVLTGLLDQAAGQHDGPALISVISGTAGVGKTALAVHWANQAAGRFPDGQLYVNLRGYDPDQPMDPGDALAGFLRALGVPGPAIPADVAERAAQFRSLLAGRRMLVLLDNASSAEQVRPLLPVPPGCMALVTSRDALAGLVARDGAVRLDLGLLPAPEAAGLLRALIGPRAVADPDATQALAAQCCGLPLALRVAAELAVARPDIALAGLVGELADQQRRLILLDAGGDPRTAVRAVFSWSSRHLPPDAARLFRLAGLHPGADLDCYAAAALTGDELPQSRRLLGALARAYLVQRTGPDRYVLHDLLRAYARELAAAGTAADGQRPALTRLFDYYLGAAGVAMDTLYPAELHQRPQAPRPETGVPPAAGPAQARAWLDLERANLVAVVVHAAAHGWPGHATQLAAILDRYLQTGGYYAEAVTVHGCACDAAGRAGDQAGQARALRSLGVADMRQARYEQAAGRLRQAVALYRGCGDRGGEARAVADLGIVDFRQGRLREAGEYYQQALTLYRECGDRAGEAHTLGNLAGLDFQQGRYPQAARRVRRSLVLFRALGDRLGEAYTVGNLGGVYLRQGRYEQAARHLGQALEMCREIGHREGEATALSGLGEADLRQGRYRQAAGYLEQSLALFRSAGNQSGEVQSLNCLGEALLGDGQADQAASRFADGLALASQIGETYEQAAAHKGLGRVHAAAGDEGRARDHWQRALTLYTSLAAPEAVQVRAFLAQYS